MFQFTDDCITGIDILDDEHRNLFDILNKAYILVTTDYHSDYYQELKNIIAELDYYAEQHFTHEEEHMVKVRDPELILQRTQHAFFRDKITNPGMQCIPGHMSIYFPGKAAQPPWLPPGGKLSPP